MAPSLIRSSSCNSIRKRTAHWTFLNSSIFYFSIFFNARYIWYIKCLIIKSQPTLLTPYLYLWEEKDKSKSFFSPKIQRSKILMKSILNLLLQINFRIFPQIFPKIIIFYFWSRSSTLLLKVEQLNSRIYRILKVKLPLFHH